jgi:hypothetical protein
MQLGSEPWIPDKQILEICHCRSETILLTPNSSCEACSAFTRVAACTLARSPYFVTRYPKASDISSPPCLLRLLPAGAVAGWDLHPLESAAFSRRTPDSGLYRRSESRPGAVIRWSAVEPPESTQSGCKIRIIFRRLSKPNSACRETKLQVALGRNYRPHPTLIAW